MSKSLSKILNPLNIGGSKKAPESAPAPAAAPAAAPSAAGVQKARGLSDRTASIQSAAAVAGVTRSENDADVLGQDNFRVKKKSASVALLGG